MVYNYDPVVIGKNLIVARQTRMLTQGAVACDLGISQSYYSKIELGKVHITIQLLANCANYFNTPMESLLGLKGTELTDKELLELKIYKEMLINKRS